jgi:hypothetical protein
MPGRHQHARPSLPIAMRGPCPRSASALHEIPPQFPETRSQIHLAQLGVVVQIGGGTGERDAAVAQDVDAVGDLEDLADLLLDDQDGDAVPR